jgi:hypothetical protein
VVAPALAGIEETVLTLVIKLFVQLAQAYI